VKAHGADPPRPDRDEIVPPCQSTDPREERMRAKDEDGGRKGSGAMEGQARSAEPARPLVPVFFNRAGVKTIEIGVSTFDCIGLQPPEDHPHVYLNMGVRPAVRCPYCSTRYRFNRSLAWNETIPPGCWVPAG
jgi:uncharacterized Zn-finger protein